jgi:hypothetical protein
MVVPELVLTEMETLVARQQLAVAVAQEHQEVRHQQILVVMVVQEHPYIQHGEHLQELGKTFLEHTGLQVAVAVDQQIFLHVIRHMLL